MNKDYSLPEGEDGLTFNEEEYERAALEAYNDGEIERAKVCALLSIRAQLEWSTSVMDDAIRRKDA